MRNLPHSLPLVNVALLKSTRVPQGAYAQQDLERLAAYVLAAQKVRGPVELTVDITGHKRIQALNRRYRGVDRTTDVISFRNAPMPHPIPLPKGEGASSRVRLQGDIAINVHQAVLQAKKMRHPLKREMRLLLIHGILHLLGYTDYEPIPRRRMFKRQNAILRNWEAKARA
jgi:probable rRNA maturation factor